MNSDPEQDRRAPERDASPSPTARQIGIVDGRIDSRDLFIGTREIIITHRTESYKLRLTSQNKLILTK